MRPRQTARCTFGEQAEKRHENRLSPDQLGVNDFIAIIIIHKIPFVKRKMHLHIKDLVDLRKRAGMFFYRY